MDLNSLIKNHGSDRTAEIFGSDIFLSKLNYLGKFSCSDQECDLFVYNTQNLMFFNKEGLLVRMERFDENLKQVISFTDVSFENIEIDEPTNTKILNEAETLEYVGNLTLEKLIN
jgi:hypothetical protein